MTQTPTRFELEHIACDLCGCQEYRLRYRKPDNWLWLTQYEYAVVRCVRCGLTYVNPRPTFESNGAFYPSGYHDDRDDAHHLARYELQFSYIASVRAQRVLDVGCARGDWLNFVKSKWPDSEVHGVDALSDGVRGRDIVFHRCVLPAVELPDDYFDLVTSWAVFEHLHTPREYFAAASRLMRPGGKLIFLVTNAESCYGKYAYAEDVPRHLYHFSEATLAQYASSCGLRLESVSYDDRLWDGRGFGTFYYGLGRLLGFTWERLYFKRLNLLQRIAMKLGAGFDRLVFSPRWEARLRRSGIIVAIMSKPSGL